MTAPEVFGVVVRTIALLITLYGVWCFAWGVFAAIRFVKVREEHEWRDYIGGSAIFMVIGIALFFGANFVEKVAYFN